MNGEIFKLWETIDFILTNRIFMGLTVAVATILNFEFLKKIPEKLKANEKICTVVFAILNGTLVVVGFDILESIFPALLMIFCPIVLIGEIAFILEDVKHYYHGLSLKSIFNFSCIYWLVANLLGMCTIKYLEKNLVFSLTMLIVSGWSFYLSRSKRFFLSKYKIMLQEKEAGKVFFKYSLICNLFLVLLTWNSKIFTMEMSIEVQRMVCGEMLIKTVFIWWCSRILFELIAKQINYVKSEEYVEKILDKERAFRNTVMGKGMLSFFIDVTRNEIQEGKEYFRYEQWNNVDNYREVFHKIQNTCVHPEDVEEFAETNSKAVIASRVDTIPYYSHQIRVATKEMLQYFKLPEEIIERYTDSGKEWAWLKIDYIYTRDELNGDLNVFVAVFDVDLQMEQGEKLKQSATVDFLTGVYNRATVEKKIEEALRQKKDAGAFFVIDVDYFKSVNDILGHPVGDRMLKQIARILKDLFRKEDFIGRLGGDEFCVFMQDVTDLDTIERKAKLLNEKCRMECQGEDDKRANISASIGIVICNQEINTYETAYKYADLALYETKKRGRDSFTIYSGNK